MSELSPLPDSRTKAQRAVIRSNGMNWVPIFCANCGADGGMVPEKNCTFAFYLCTPCSEKWEDVLGTYSEPDTVFWDRVKEEQLSQYGRELTAEELIEVLLDGNSSLSKLAKDKPDFNRIKME